MALLSLVIQIAATGVFRQYRFRSGDDHFAFGWEMGRIARSLASGQGFSNPYGDSTGPTAWEPPLYPFLMGEVFRIFGVYSTASAWVLLILNSLFNALTCIPIYFTAQKTMGGRVAIWSAWIWALLPYEMYWAIHWPWDTTFSPLLLAFVFWLSLEFEQRGGWKLWTVYGLLWGLIALSNPSLLSFLPFSGLWIWWRRHKRGLNSLNGAALASLVFFLCIAPWMIRNYRVFGRPVFIRDDFGLQFRLGNGPYADGWSRVYLQPNLNVAEFAEFKRLGELAYARRCQALAFAWVRENPGRFALLSLKKFFYYWAGIPRPTNSLGWFDFRNSVFLASSVLAFWGLVLALKRNLPGAWLYLWLVLSYPAIYYFVYPHARYRHPIEPEMLILVVYVFFALGRQRTNHELNQLSS
jgi:4-amino-4-deoxy-L-arabinose transferase-like glycosyltransferase